MLTSKHGQQEPRMSQILGSDPDSFEDLRLPSPTNSGPDPRWDGRGNQRQMHRTRTTVLKSCPLLCPSSRKGRKPSSKQHFNGSLLVLDQLWHLASSSLPAPEKWQSFQISCGLSSASFLITVCVQEASLLEQVLLLFLHIQIVFIALNEKKIGLNLL